MKIGLITESKYDYEAFKCIIAKVLDDKSIEFEGAFKTGKSAIIQQKKVFGNKLHNQKCSVIIIIMDSDGGNVEHIKDKLKVEYDSTAIKDKYIISIAVEEIEAWFLSDIDCLKGLYDDIRSSARLKFSGVTDAIHSPKEVLKQFVIKESKGTESYIESDSIRLAQLINVETATSNSNSFSEFCRSIGSISSTKKSTIVDNKAEV